MGRCRLWVARVLLALLPITALLPCLCHATEVQENHASCHETARPDHDPQQVVVHAPARECCCTEGRLAGVQAISVASPRQTSPLALSVAAAELSSQDVEFLTAPGRLIRTEIHSPPTGAQPLRI